MTRNKWIYQGIRIEAYRDGCASQPCIHVANCNISMTIKEIEELQKRLDKAIRYCKGRKRKYKDKTHNWNSKK